MVRLISLLGSFSLLFWITAILAVDPALSHEVRPAALELIENADGNTAITWKQPLLSGRRLQLEPVLPDHCAPVSERQRQLTDNAVIERWSAICTLDRGQLVINGLDRTLTDVFVRLTRPGEEMRTTILRPARASLDLGGKIGSPVQDYLWIGAEHMLFGWDHLLFVLGLLLLCSRQQIIWVITAFTLGHSITLAITALGLFSLPSGPVELLIALSIFFLAVEVVRQRAGQTSLTIRHPWLIALGFGLLHGLGFAGALAEIGLPAGEEIWALLLFNIGIELAQIFFVLLLLGAAGLFALLARIQPERLVMPAAYLVGSLGAFASLERMFS